ncbi:MAG: hypothetical protein IPN61_18290 [Bacteroidetes bacterium]|nr:hypothetical protein [Bacteroidota bacterium]
MNTDLKPEDFWSGAEILLDNHYKVKRRRKAALWIISVLTIAGSLLYIASDKSVILSDSHKGIETPVAAIEKTHLKKIIPCRKTFLKTIRQLKLQVQKITKPKF